MPSDRVARRIGQPRVLEALPAQATAVARAAVQPLGSRIVARPAHASIEPEPVAFPYDIGLGHVLQRRVDLERFAFDPRLRGELSQPLERGDELRSAIRIARIIE